MSIQPVHMGIKNPTVMRFEDSDDPVTGRREITLYVRDPSGNQLTITARPERWQEIIMQNRQPSQSDRLVAMYVNDEITIEQLEHELDKLACIHTGKRY